MKLYQILTLFIFVLFVNCNTSKKDSTTKTTYSDISNIGAMKNVMWKGELEGIISLDTIKNKENLYGLGPKSFLTGEILINNGKSYHSIVLSDSTMLVEKTYALSAPFFVYANVNEWKKVELPKNIKTIKNLETFIDQRTITKKRPFAFKLRGKIRSGDIHVQNLHKGTKVSSPKEAHSGQTNYSLLNETVEIIGFFSTQHQGIFTHHDSFLHMHLITKDESKMGHLDKVDFDKIILFLPEM